MLDNFAARPIKMTAEIAILNRNAVALAADSAVTLQNSQGQKIYNTANKLFMLSKHRPVGIMIFGSADLMAVPWETIVKMYRAELGRKGFDRLEQYAEHFLDFFHRENLLFPADLQEQFVEGYLGYHLSQLKKGLLTEIENIIKLQGSIADSSVPSVVKDFIDRFGADLVKAKNLPSFGESEIVEVIERYRPIIEQMIATEFERLPIDVNQIVQCCGLLIGKRVFINSSSGVVIAGFGEHDVFPSLYAYDCQAIVGNRMRYVPTNRVRIGVTATAETDASISPFAQREMVNRFMEGIDPVYQAEIQSYLSELLRTGYPAMILDAIGGKINETEKSELKEKLSALGDKLATEFNEQSNRFRQKNYIGPVISTVASLPKDELAAMAESLVNLTSFKRRVTSAEQDTVGGPIDVAVISKGDGFIWIKRKHYFDKDLNPYFFANYYRKDEVEHDG